MEKLFRIIELSPELVEDIALRSYDAHFHDFEEIILLTQGSMEHLIDYNVEVVSAPTACFVSMGKMHKVVPQPDLRGWLINYKPEFIPDSRMNFYANFLTSTNIPLTSCNTCIDRFDKLCKIIHTEYKQAYIDYSTIRHLVHGLISMIDAERKRNLPIEEAIKGTQIKSFLQFLQILGEHYKTDVGVSFYAEKMGMSERNLNLICRNNFQKSVTEIIETRKLVEAKRLLLYTDKSVSEIGFELGYNEKSYFTRVFHNKMGITPSRYREMTRSIMS